MESVRLHQLAVHEYRSARNWNRHRDASVATRFRDAVDSTVNRICADAHSHPVLVDDVRWVPVRRFPYILVFVRGKLGHTAGARTRLHKTSSRLLKATPINVFEICSDQNPAVRVVRFRRGTSGSSRLFDESVASAALNVLDVESCFIARSSSFRPISMSSRKAFHLRSWSRINRSASANNSASER